LEHAVLKSQVFLPHHAFTETMLDQTFGPILPIDYYVA